MLVYNLFCCCSPFQMAPQKNVALYWGCDRYPEGKTGQCQVFKTASWPLCCIPNMLCSKAGDRVASADQRYQRNVVFSVTNAKSLFWVWKCSQKSFVALTAVQCQGLLFRAEHLALSKKESQAFSNVPLWRSSLSLHHKGRWHEEAQQTN